jgi:hypothetical protein
VEEIKVTGEISPTVEAEVAGFDMCVRALLEYGALGGNCCSLPS